MPKLNITISSNARSCDCCGKKGLLRTVCYDLPNMEKPVHLGVICTQREFGINMSGNPYKAAARLAEKLAGEDLEEIEARLTELVEW